MPVSDSELSRRSHAGHTENPGPLMPHIQSAHFCWLIIQLLTLSSLLFTALFNLQSLPLFFLARVSSWEEYRFAPPSLSGGPWFCFWTVIYKWRSKVPLQSLVIKKVCMLLLILLYLCHSMRRTWWPSKDERQLKQSHFSWHNRL